MTTLSPTMDAYTTKSFLSKIRTGIVCVLLALLVSSCASSGGSRPNASGADADKNRILACKVTDTLVNSSSQCLQDDAACYQISNGQWCTGERGNVCPTGSSALAAGVACPIGTRCFRVSESLECAIN